MFSVTTQMPGAMGYTGGKVVYIDTENTFRPDRLRPISDRFNLDQSAVLDNVLYARAYTSNDALSSFSDFLLTIDFWSENRLAFTL